MTPSAGRSRRSACAWRARPARSRRRSSAPWPRRADRPPRGRCSCSCGPASGARSRAWPRRWAITGATLTHHLNGLEAQGLVRRWREQANRRVQLVELTPEGEALFEKLRAVAVAHDRRLREGLDDADLARLAELLDRLQANVA